MKVNKVNTLCSAVKQKINDSPVVRAYKVYQYYSGNLETSFDFFERLQPISFKRAFLKLVSKM